MSGEVQRLYILFDADGKPYIKGLKGLERQSAESASTMEKRFKDAGDKIGRALKRGLAVGALAVAGIGIYAVKTAAQFEYEMDRVQAVSNATGTEMQQLGDLALQLGKDTVYSSGQAAQGLYALATAGVSVADIMGGAAEAALALASAGELEVGRAAEVAAAAMNVFGLAGKDVMSVADALAAGATKSAVEVSDLADAFQMSASVAAQAGWSVQELTAALSLMGNAGLRGSDAGTSLKQMLMQLEVPSDKAAKAMEELGINIYDANGKMYDAKTVIGNLEAAFAPLNQQQRDYNAGVIFGTDAIRAANILIGKGATAYGEMATAVSKAGEANRIATIKMDNLKGSWEQLMGSLETAAIDIGGKVLPKIREVVDRLTGIVNDAIETGDWSALTDEIAKIIGEGIQAATPYIADAVGMMLRETPKALFLVGFEWGKQIGEGMREGMTITGTAQVVADLLREQGNPYLAAEIESSAAAVQEMRRLQMASKFGAGAVGAVESFYDRQQRWSPGTGPEVVVDATAPPQAGGPASAAAAGQTYLAAAMKHTTEISQEQKDAWQELGVGITDYNRLTDAQIGKLDELTRAAGELADSLQGIADSTLDPAAIWEEADGSLKKYLKSLKQHQQDWGTFQDSLKTIATTYGAAMGEDAPSILQKFISLGPDELAKLKKAGPKAIDAFISSAKTQLAVDSPAFTRELLALAGVDFGPQGEAAADKFVTAWGDPILPVTVKPAQLTKAWQAIVDYFEGKHITIDTRLGGYGGATGYDAGGYIQPGINVVVNRTGVPEPVLNPSQWEAIQQLVKGVTAPSMDSAGPAGQAASDGTALIVSELRSVADRVERAIVQVENLRVQHDRDKVRR